MSALGAPATRFTPGRLGPLALLLGEYLAITLTFDALPLLQGTGLGSGFGHLGIAAPLLVVVATMTQVLGGRKLRAELARVEPDAGGRQRVLWLVGLNLVSYAGLFALTGALLSHSGRGVSIPLSWLAGWVVLALVTCASLVFVVVPPRAALVVARRSGGVLLASLGVGALAWFAGVASGRLWELLRKLTLDSVYLLLTPFTDEIGYAPEDAILGVGEFFVVVAPECSGLEGIGLILVVLAVYLWSARAQLRFPRAFWLLPLGVALVWAGNTVRIALLIAVGVHWSPEIALSGFHSKAGWLFFCAIGLSLIAFAQRSPVWSRLPERASAHAGAEPGWNPTAVYLAPQLALLATSLLTGLFALGLDLLYGLRIVAVLGALYLYRAHLPRPSWPPSWQAPLIGVAVFAIWLWLAPRADATAVAALRTDLADLPPVARGSWLALRVIGSTLAVPIAEELAFRAFLLRRLIDPDFTQVEKTRLTPLALIASSLAFALLHGQAWLAALVAGVAYALAQRARGRTSDAIVAHALTNGLIAADVLLLDAYWLWA